MSAALACAMVVALWPTFARAEEPIMVALPVDYAFESSTTAQLRKDCKIAELVGTQVLENVKAGFAKAERTDDWRNAGARPIVRVSITDLQLAGPSSAIRLSQSRITVRVELYQDGERKSFVELRSASAPYSDEPECRPFERMSVVLGKNVATWLPLGLRLAAANRADSQSAAKPVTQ